MASCWKDSADANPASVTKLYGLMGITSKAKQKLTKSKIGLPDREFNSAP